MSEPSVVGKFGHTAQWEHLREAGLRPTIPRLVVLQVFDDAEGLALSPSEVYRRLGLRGLSVSMGTIYGVMQQLEKQGLLQPAHSDKRKQMCRQVAQGPEQMPENAIPLWVVNRGTGERTLLHNPELRTLLLEAMDDAGLNPGEGDFAIEFGRERSQGQADLS